MMLKKAIKDFLKPRDKTFEGQINLVANCKLAVRGRDVGAFLLQTKDPLSDNGGYAMTFGFRFSGINLNRYQDGSHLVLKRIQAGLKMLPDNQKLRIHMRSFSDIEELQAEQQLKESPPLELQYLLMSDRKKIIDQNAQKKRQQRELIIFVTHQIGDVGGERLDLVEKPIYVLQKLYDKINGVTDLDPYHHYRNLLMLGFDSGFLPLESLLRERMSLDVEPMTSDELWQYGWNVFNQEAAPKNPYRLILNDRGGSPQVSQEISDTIDPVSLMIRGANATPSKPLTSKSTVGVRGKLVAAIALEEKPAQFDTPEDQLFWLWDALQYIPDIEFVCEVERAPTRMATFMMQRVTKQSVVQVADTAKQRDVDVRAGNRLNESVEAQNRIYSGEIPLWASALCFIHRDTPQQLTEACSLLANLFTQGKFVRDVDIVPDLWVRSLPFVSGKLLKDGRRQMMFSDEIAALLPLPLPYTGDDKGLELSTKEGNSPFFIDFVNKFRGMIVIGQSRSGKSVLASSIYLHAIASGMNLIALDYPKPDGRTTCEDLVKFLGPDIADYYNVGEQSNNLFEGPNPYKMTHLSARDIEQRLDGYRKFLVDSLVTMVMGMQENATTKRVRTILSQCIYAFFENPQIVARFDAAYQGGMGYQAWENIPTLSDFIPFVEDFQLNMDGSAEVIDSAKATIVLELRNWLLTPTGKSISSPSTVNTDSQFLVFALRDVSEGIEAAVLALSAQSLAFRKASEMADCLISIDESPIILKFPALAQTAGNWASNGLAAGIKLILLSQDPESIANSSVANQLVQNLTTRLVGKVTENGAQSLNKLFGYSLDTLRQNTSESYSINPQALSTSWLVDMDGHKTHTNLYSTPELLAAVMNNSGEKWLRQHITNQFPDNKYIGHQKLTDIYVKALQNGTLDDLMSERFASSSSKNPLTGKEHDESIKIAS
jgi:hypothetical protein